MSNSNSININMDDTLGVTPPTTFKPESMGSRGRTPGTAIIWSPDELQKYDELMKEFYGVNNYSTKVFEGMKGTKTKVQIRERARIWCRDNDISKPSSQSENEELKAFTRNPRVDRSPNRLHKLLPNKLDDDVSLANANMVDVSSVLVTGDEVTADSEESTIWHNTTARKKRKIRGSPEMVYKGNAIAKYEASFMNARNLVVQKVTGKEGQVSEPHQTAILGAVETMSLVFHEMKEWFLEGIDPSRYEPKFNKQFEGIMARMTLMEEKLEGVGQVVSSTNCKIESLASKDPVVAVKTYAQVVKAPKLTGAAKTVRLPENVVVVRPKGSVGATSSDETIRIMKSLIDPMGTGLQVRGVNKLREGGVVVRLLNEEGTKKLLNSEELSSAGLSVELPKRHNPKVIIFDVPEDIPPDKIRSCIVHQNLDIKFSENEKDFRPLFKTGRKLESLNNWVIEVSTDLRTEICKKGRVFIGWRSSRVEDFTRPRRCMKCHSFGHLAKHCKVVENELCLKCCEAGHRRIECKQTEFKCINCARAGKEHLHDVLSKECPCLKAAIQLEVRRTDYGT